MRLSKELKRSIENTFTKYFLETGDTITTIEGYKQEILEFIYNKIESGSMIAEAKLKANINYRIEQQIEEFIRHHNNESLQLPLVVQRLKDLQFYVKDYDTYEN